MMQSENWMCPFNTQYFAFSWRYLIFNKPSWNAGFTIGARWLKIGTGIKLESNFADYSRETSVGVPTILFGIHGAGYLTPKLLARYTFEYFQLNVNGIVASVEDNRFSLEYYLFRQFGLGFAFSNTAYKVTEVPFNKKFSGDIKFSFSGFSVFVASRF